MVVKQESVAIVTFQGNYNYGNRLQNYAVDRVYRTLGLKPTSLVLKRKPAIDKRIKKAIKAFLKCDEPSPEASMTALRKEAFDDFNKRMSFREVYSVGRELANAYDWFSVGSDQIWYLDKGKADEDWRFLCYVPSKKRLTTSPSLGRDDLGELEGKRLASYLLAYPSVSVRERRGADLIKRFTGIKATVTCDPTLVLSANEWRAVADDRLTPGEPYVFTYLLGGVGSEAADVLEKVTEYGRISAVPLSDRQKLGELDAGPAEFISLIDNAVHVVTDSFHAAVFSSILQTPLTIVHREGGASMFSRLETLSQTLGITEKVYGSRDYNLALAGCYDGVPEAIACERARFMGYLESCLNAQKASTTEGACE